MSTQKALHLSDKFVQWARKRVLIYLLKNPRIILAVNIAIAWNKIRGYPVAFPPGWFPKNVLGTIFERELEKSVIGSLTIIAMMVRRSQREAERGMDHVIIDGVGNGLYWIGADRIADPVRECMLLKLPVLEVIPGFFNELYTELVRISTKKTTSWWYLWRDADGLFVRVPEKNMDKPGMPRLPFKKARSV